MSALIRLHTVLRLAGLSRSTSLLTAMFHRSFSSGFASCWSSRGLLPRVLECIGADSADSAEAVARHSRVIASLVSGAACCLFRAVRLFTCARRASRITLMCTAIVRLRSSREPSWSVLRCVRWPTCERSLPRLRDSGYRRHMNQSPNKIGGSEPRDSLLFQSGHHWCGVAEPGR